MPRTERAAIVQARQVLTSRGWLSHQPPAFQEAVLARGVVRSFRRNETVHAPGVEMPGIFAVISGIVCLGGIPLPGFEAMVWPAASGFWFGALGLVSPAERSDFFAASTPQTGARVLLVPRERMHELIAADPVVAGRLAKITAGHLALTLRLLIETSAALPAPTRLAHLLVLLASYGEVPRLAQHHFGAMLGISRVTINKHLGEMDAAGLIVRRGSQIKVPDPRRLTGWKAG